MAAIFSEARLRANRQNAQRSTGPKTEAGKARSRANAVKHGLTGAGIALPVEDAAEVERRFAAIQGELTPQTVLGAYFAHQVALMTVRTQRAARQESAALTKQVRRAGAEFDKARATAANRLFARLGGDPARVRRRLLATPEGVDRLLGGLRALALDLAGDEVVWYLESTAKVALLGGERAGPATRSRGYWLARGVEGDLSGLDPAEYAHLETVPERQTWAAEELTAFLDGEIARLRAHRATLDLEAIATARAEAEEIALFDPSKEATLARKYEAASTRVLFQALDGLHAVEADADPERRATAEPDLAAWDAAGADLDAADPADDAGASEPKSGTAKHLEPDLGSFEPAPAADGPRPSPRSVPASTGGILPLGDGSVAASGRLRARSGGRS